MAPRKGDKRPAAAPAAGETQQYPLHPAPQNMPANQERREVGEYWDRLRQLVDNAQTAAINGRDPELDATGRARAEELTFRFEEQEAIDADAGVSDDDQERRRDDTRPAAERLDAYATNTAARFMDLSARPPFGSRLSGRMALLYLMRADWQFQLALDMLEDSINAGDEELLADAEGPAAREEAELSRAAGRQGRGRTLPYMQAVPVVAVGPQTHQATPSQAQMAALNATTDREAALCGRPEPGKFAITLVQPSGGSKTLSYSNQQGFNWQDPLAIRSLNKWRAQIFLRILGPKQEARIQYQPAELDWLENYIRHLEAQAVTAGGEFNLRLVNFNYLAQAFNRRFQGSLVPGSDIPRPRRTISSLRSELGRIPEVVRMTGMAVKKGAPTLGGPSRGGGRGGRGNGRGGNRGK